MPASFLKDIFSASDSNIIAIAIGNERESVHSGLVYKIEDNDPQIIHLGDHCFLANEPIHKRNWYSISNLKLEYPQIILVDFCIKAILNRGTVLVGHKNFYTIDYPYGISFVKANINSDDGALMLAPGSSGLTCATFVMTILASANIELIKQSEWNQRAPNNQTDLSIQIKHIQHMIRSNREQYIVNENIMCLPCNRYRPEEIAAAAYCSPYPASFGPCEQLGEKILEALNPFLG